ncbi:MAG: hypothetical protein O7B29_10700 [Deltaproteobacteria bacterium]|nr:hypothetical protein [Deltaproteobacteria bacterium]TDJ05051.1 MAG: hypothetical protein E2O71_12105 [Deltaproteobacteria bacterium]
MRPFRELSALVCVFALGGVAAAETPHINYMLECQGCHLADGTGFAGKVPALKNFVGRFLTVTGGREFLVRVPGSAQSALDDRELAEVLNWIIRRFGPDDVSRDFVAFTREEVMRYRGRPLTDVESVRSELMRHMRGRPD